MRNLRMVGAVAFLASLLLFFFTVLSGRLAAQGGGGRSERALILALAKISVNEAGVRLPPAEMGVIWQVVEHQGSTHDERLRWLSTHSPCVLGDGSVGRPGNCRWTRGLLDNDSEPDGWAESYPHLHWARFVPRWRQVRELSRRLVTGQVVIRPCPETPITWGSRILDMRQALVRGLRPLNCRDEHGNPTLNEGFARVER